MYMYCMYVQDMMLLVFLLSRCGGVVWIPLEFNMITVSMLSGDNLINLVNNFFFFKNGLLA